MEIIVNKKGREAVAFATLPPALQICKLEEKSQEPGKI
jgi:hypothetical protein